MNTIVAGVDGSTSALHAVAWAATEAAPRREKLRLVSAYAVPEHGYPAFLTSVGELREGLRAQGEDRLREAREAAEKAAPGIDVETVLVEADPTVTLLGESRTARVVVLGSRGLGGFSGLLVGSTAVALAAHGSCPVVVVRGRGAEGVAPAEGPVVVGLDGSPASVAAIEFAFAEASARGLPLVAVRTWNDVMLEATLRMYPLSVNPDDIDAEERALLEAQVDAVREDYPEVPVEAVVARGRAARTLLEHSERAQLVVVGSRGRGGFRGLLLGSTSRALVTHASCPVAVVRPPATGENR
ncbi:universal stress protein [Prauserella sp. PE36]|uniref:universal stress protein n=1 Tax=Prauserella sp. PE36 TaxID=1504709 RepID=UPI000D9BE5B7|nr:universal stress protein [Prauserella sp. PE36]PXY30343.1 universal stress protein [Prauserella coralliicola]RBM21064.1 universal stress protein [Prauserella sp. PE36]